jgi:hypothetical protein
LHPPRDRAHLLKERVQLGVGGDVVLVDGSHDGGELIFDHRELLPGRWTERQSRSNREIGFRAAIRKSLPTTDGFTHQAEPRNQKWLWYQLTIQGSNAVQRYKLEFREESAIQITDFFLKSKLQISVYKLFKPFLCLPPASYMPPVGGAGMRGRVPRPQGCLVGPLPMSFTVFFLNFNKIRNMNNFQVWTNNRNINNFQIKNKNRNMKKNSKFEIWTIFEDEHFSYMNKFEIWIIFKFEQISYMNIFNI